MGEIVYFYNGQALVDGDPDNDNEKNGDGDPGNDHTHRAEVVIGMQGRKFGAWCAGRCYMCCSRM